MARIVIDWLKRLAGHLQIVVEAESNVITAAYVSGTAFRGWEEILRERQVTDAIQLCQRLCSTCSVGHSIAAAQVIEEVMQRKITSNAAIIRNIILALSFIHNHIQHFFKLALLDYVEGPQIALLNSTIPDLRVKGMDAKLWHEHYWQADSACCTAHEMLAVCGGKVPHLAANVPGGITIELGVDQLLALESRLNSLREFIEQVYLPDVYLLAKIYPEWLDLGKGWGNYLTSGAFGDFPAGALIKGKFEALATKEIHEDTTFTWELQRPNQGYSWIKAARYREQVMEVGPLARMLLKGAGPVKKLGPQANSVMGRHIARAEEAKLLVDLIKQWLGQLKLAEPTTVPQSSIQLAQGTALLEGPGGIIGHWMSCQDEQIIDYHILSPGNWNASPRDRAKQPGPMEKALEGLPYTNELLTTFVGRVIRSFDPCLDCAAH